MIQILLTFCQSRCDSLLHGHILPNSECLSGAGRSTKVHESKYFCIKDFEFVTMDTPHVKSHHYSYKITSETPFFRYVFIGVLTPYITMKMIAKSQNRVIPKYKYVFCGLIGGIPLIIGCDVFSNIIIGKRLFGRKIRFASSTSSH